MDINRKTAYLTLIDIETKKQYSNIALNLHIKKLEPDSKAFVRELVYGVLENRIFLDYIIQKLIKTKIKNLRRQDLTILRMGIYQILRMDNVPDYAATSETVKLAKKYCVGRHNFVNAVLREYLRRRDEISLPSQKEDIEEYLSIKYSFKKWIVSLWINQYGVGFAKELLEASNARPPLVARINLNKVSRASVIKNFCERGIEAVAVDEVKTALRLPYFEVTSDELYTRGYLSIQDLASQTLIEELNLEDRIDGRKAISDEKFIVVDVCAAPGGKSFAIAERLGDFGKVYSFDIYDHKLSDMGLNAKRLGLDNVEMSLWDATKLKEDIIEVADIAIADVPCSGLGVVRRRPEIKYKGADIVDPLVKKQREIIRISSRYVKDGGVLVYSTCTLNRAENQVMVSEFLSENKEFMKEKEIELFPNVNETDGFYICIMKKLKEK